jgi:hypothetical protein
MQKKNKNKTDDGFVFEYNSTLITVIGLILFVFYGYYFGYNKIGTDYRYLIIINILPLLSGTLFIIYRSRKIIKSIIKVKNALFVRVINIVMHFISALLLSYFTLGFVSKITWDYFNLKEARQSEIEHISCKITKVIIGVGKHGPEIEFLYNGKTEKLPINYDSYSECSPLTAEVELDIKKGIWDSYVVENYRIKQTDSKSIEKF